MTIALVLALVLIVPLLCRKIHLPSIVGLILAGIVIGPHALGLVDRTPTLDLFCQLGILYIMFLSGVEIDIDDFRRERKRSILFGCLTFFIPLLLGIATGMWLSMPWLTTLLFASLFSSHTLITWPVVSRYSVQRDKSVAIAVGGTVFAVTGAMIILAAVSSIAEQETASMSLIWRMVAGSAVMLTLIFVVMPRIARWFFYRYNDSIAEWLFVMLLATIGGALAYLSGIEPILGVFLTALSLNKHIPHLSPLMNRITFVGNAVFVPVFLLSVGTLIDLRVLAQGWAAAMVAVVMIVVALVSKWVAALIAQKIMGFSRARRRMLYGLSNAHAAGALATVTIGYGIIMPDGTHLLSEEVLNGTILMILASCIVASFFTEQAARSLADESEQTGMSDNTDSNNTERQVLLPVANPDTNRGLLELAILLLNRHPETRLHAAAILRTDDDTAAADRLLNDTARQAAEHDINIYMHKQKAVNVPNGIRAVVKDRRITHVVTGMTIGKEEKGFGKAVGPLIPLAGQQIWLYNAVTPLSNIRTVRVLVPVNAEKEYDYNGWQQCVGNIVEQLHAEATQETINSWTILPRISTTMSDDELLIIVQARRSTTSWAEDMTNVPQTIRRHFADKNVIVLFPAQHIEEEEDNILLNEYARSGESTYSFIQRLTARRK
ncbi:MAG: cation:proton antiporter [Paludibacteraceae bacterium]|nr:cation:proton antiporter [Paludibacteraceae bacterium]